MRKEIIISVLALIFIGGLLVFYNPRPLSNPAQENSPTQEKQQKLESRRDSQANVTIIVTPSDLSSAAKEWKFKAVLDTHVVELDQDMAEVAVLVDNNKKEYKPLRWEGAPVGGHHREGILIFAPIVPFPPYITLTINDIGGVPRSFTWTLSEK